MSGRDTTNNGWNVVDGDQVTRIFVGNDPDGCTFLAGDVAALFEWFFTQIHNRVEPVTMLNGHRDRVFNAAVGGAAGSNHVSGTAGDVNGYKHPYEAHTKPWYSGWTPAQQNTVRAIMAETGGLISWGLDYAVGWRDSMHFDIRSGVRPAQVRAFVASLTPAPTPTPPVPTRKDVSVYLIRNRDSGEIFEVSDIALTPIPDENTARIIATCIGAWTDMSGEQVQAVRDQTSRRIIDTANNLKGQGV